MKVGQMNGVPAAGVPERVEQMEQQVRQILNYLDMRLGAAMHPSVSRMIRPETAPQPATSFPAGRAKMIRAHIRERRRRERFFRAELFADPAWDMMLDLHAAFYERREVSVSSLCIAANVPATTALRWIKTMTDAGLFIREADPHDGRRIFIALSDETRDAMDEYFDDIGG